MLRKAALVLGACMMAVVLTACGDPSADGAAELGKQMLGELYKGNAQPLLDHVDFNGLAENQSDAMLAQGLLQGKLKEAAKEQQKQAESYGGVDSIDVVSKTENNGIYKIDFKVNFANGKSKNSHMKFKWSEETKSYWITD